MGEGFRTRDVDRHGNNASENAAEKRPDPRCAVLAPDQDAVAFYDSPLFQQCRETAAEVGKGLI